MNDFPAPTPGTSAADSNGLPRFHEAPAPSALETSGSGNWIGAIAAAIAMQVGAAMTIVGAIAIFLIAAFSTFGDASATTPAYIVLSLPVAIGGIALFVMSGRVASRIAKDSRGWLMLIAGPVALMTLRIVPIILGF